MPASSISPEAAYLTRSNIVHPDPRPEVVAHDEKVGLLAVADESPLVTYEAEYDKEPHEVNLQDRLEADGEVVVDPTVRVQRVPSAESEEQRQERKEQVEAAQNGFLDEEPSEPNPGTDPEQVNAEAAEAEQGSDDE